MEEIHVDYIAGHLSLTLSNRIALSFFDVSWILWHFSCFFDFLSYL